MWLHESAFAVKTFLQIPNSVAFLVSQVGNSIVLLMCKNSKKQIRD